MAQVTCSRCFAVFEVGALRPGQAPLCPDCAPRLSESGGRAVSERPALTPTYMPALTPSRGVERPAGLARARRPTPTRPSRSRGGRTTAVALIGGLIVAAIVVAILVARRAPAPEGPALSPVAEKAQQWKQQGLASGVPPGLNPRAVADQRIAAGQQALAADLPERIPEALRAFRDALAADPNRLDALAGWVIALASQPAEAIGGEDLTTAHELLAWARERSPERPELVAAYARILLAVPSAKNRAEALSVAWKAGALAPRDADARLALGLSRLADDPAGAIRVLDAELDRPEIDRRLLTAAARARWAAGDVDRALALAERRLALDSGHSEALELEAEILLSGGQATAAKGVLQRYASAHGDSPRPLFMLGRIAAQVDGKLYDARKLLQAALARKPDDFLAVRILAQLAAVERAVGDGAAAQRAVDSALGLVPASAVAQYQSALLAFNRGDARAVREAAGVVGDRGGPYAEAALKARALELSATAEEAVAAWEAAATAARYDPAPTLVAAGAAARLGFPSRAVALTERLFLRDLGEAKLQRMVTDFWDSAPPLAESSRRLVAVASGARHDAGMALVAAGAAEILQGRAGRAEELGRRAISVAPQLASGFALLGYVAGERGDHRAATAWADAALELHPGLASALATRARALEASGKRLEAQRAWREALDAVPDLVTGRIALARLLALDGKREEAKAMLLAAVKDAPAAVEVVGALREFEKARAPAR